MNKVAFLLEINNVFLEHIFSYSTFYLTVHDISPFPVWDLCSIYTVHNRHRYSICGMPTAAVPEAAINTDALAVPSGCLA